MFKSLYKSENADKEFIKHWEQIGMAEDDYDYTANGHFCFGWDAACELHHGWDDLILEILWAVENNDKEWLEEQIIEARKLFKTVATGIDRDAELKEFGENIAAKMRIS